MQVFQDSTRTYMSDPKFAEMLNESQQKVVTENQTANTSDEDLSKEETIKYMMKIEEAKVESMAQIQFGIAIKRVPPQAAPMLMEQQKLKAFD